MGFKTDRKANCLQRVYDKTKTTALIPQMRISHSIMASRSTFPLERCSIFSIQRLLTWISLLERGYIRCPRRFFDRLQRDTSRCNSWCGRITLLRWTIMFAAFGFLFNMLTVFALYLEEVFSARVIFGSCCLSMIISILFFIREIHISTNALKLHMADMDVDVN